MQRSRRDVIQYDLGVLVRFLDIRGRSEAVYRKAALAFKTNVGVRFKQWHLSDTKPIREDVVQNVMLIANGILAIVFAIGKNVFYDN